MLEYQNCFISGSLNSNIFIFYDLKIFKFLFFIINVNEPQSTVQAISTLLFVARLLSIRDRWSRWTFKDG